MAARKGSRTTLAIAAAVVVIIVIALVLLAYKPGGTTLGGLACAPKSGFSCLSAVYHINGNITLFLGQSTGYNWAIASAIFVPSTAAYSNGVPIVTWSAATTLHNGLADYATVNVTIPATGPVYVGTAINGTIWVSYQQEVGGTVYYAEIGVIHARST